MSLKQRWNSLKLDSRPQTIDPKSIVWCCPISFVFYDLMICFLFIVDLFYLPWNWSFGGIDGCVLNLARKLEFSSYLALILVQHEKMRSWVVYILIPPMPIIMSIGPWATSSRARRTRPGRAGFGWYALTTCRHERSSIQRFLNLELFLVLSI